MLAQRQDQRGLVRRAGLASGFRLIVRASAAKLKLRHISARASCVWIVPHSADTFNHRNAANRFLFPAFNRAGYVVP
jgi:hypothetical protein